MNILDYTFELIILAMLLKFVYGVWYNNFRINRQIDDNSKLMEKYVKLQKLYKNRGLRETQNRR